MLVRLEALALLTIGLHLLKESSATTPVYDATSTYVYDENVTTAADHNPPITRKIPLYIAGFFSSGDSWDGTGMIPSIELAVNHVNANDDILSEYELNLTWKDSKCQPSDSIWAFYQHLLEKPQKMMLLGPACSTATQPIAATAHNGNLVTISYAAASPLLSNRDKFPYFFRTYVSENLLNPSKIWILSQFNWNRIATISEDHDLFTVTNNDLLELLKKHNKTAEVSENFVKKPSERQVSVLKEKDMRIFVVQSYEDASRQLFCQVYHQQLYGKGFVWVLPGWYSNQWWRKDKLVEGCTFDQLETAVVESMYISVEASNFTTSPDDDRIAGIKAKDYERELHLVRKKLEESGKKFPFSGLEPFGYDALWAVALALNKSQNDLALEGRRLEDFTYDDNITGTVMFEAMKSTIFSGVSGPVSFAGGDRKGDTNIEQLKGTCRSDWESFQFYCYKFVNESKDWQSARQFCRNLADDKDAYLVSALSKVEIDFIRSSVLQGEWDIGLTYYSSYGRIVWVDTNDKNVTVHPNDDSEIDERATCPIWNITSNKWKSVNCKKKMPFICKMRPDFTEKLIVTLSQSEDGTLQPTWHSGFTWYDDEIPADRTPAMEVGLTPLGFAVVGGIAFLGILMALAFLSFNILARKHRFVKLSSPRLNNVIIVGCILVYLSVCSLGLNLDFQNGENRHFKQFCMLRIWLLSVGFVLGFGAIFSKTWRVYKVASLKGGIRPVKIKDSALFTKVGILLALDLVVLSIWQLSDPLRHKLQNIDLEHYVYTCDCQHAALWSGILFVYKGLILAFGVFIAWQTRNVTIPALNDSKGIALCVYNTTVLCVVGVGTAVILADSPTVQNVFLSLIMNFCATFALIVIFVPKIKFVYHHPHADRNISSTSSVTSLSQRPVRSQATEPDNLQGYETREGRQLSGTRRNIQKYQYKESPRSSDKNTDGSVATPKQTEEDGYSPQIFSKIASTLGNLKRHQRESSSTTNQE